MLLFCCCFTRRFSPMMPPRVYAARGACANMRAPLSPPPRAMLPCRYRRLLLAKALLEAGASAAACRGVMQKIYECARGATLRAAPPLECAKKPTHTLRARYAMICCCDMRRDAVCVQRLPMISRQLRFFALYAPLPAPFHSHYFRDAD